MDGLRKCQGHPGCRGIRAWIRKGNGPRQDGRGRHRLDLAGATSWRALKVGFVLQKMPHSPFRIEHDSHALFLAKPTRPAAAKIKLRAPIGFVSPKRMVFYYLLGIEAMLDHFRCAPTARG